MQTEDYPFLMDPKIDFAFKQIFAGKQKESKIVLISLLNAILDRKDQEAITDIIYLNPYTDKPYEDAKQSILDIKVKTAEEELIDIEIQIRNIDNYRKRSLYYWSTMYGEQIIEGEAYYELNPCIVINIMDFNLLDETDRYHSIFEIRERNLGFQLVSDLEIHYLELRKLAEEVDINNLTTLEEWLIFIRDAAKKEKRELIETIRKRNEVIDMAEKILARASADEMARAAYQQRRKWYLDKVSSEKYLLMKGREEGREEVAKAALRKEMPIEIISEITGLTIEDIKKLKEKMKG
ncbi:MAG: Rpn family recombination-promoting nuclease/putative transposase [Clostridiales bacterium]|nr:Rpn family recombination-promoting nuclease/putative transposase [Clostridiales bacterium]